MSIPTLIVSKDRACQLDLLLQSLSKNSPDLFDITVIWKASDHKFLLGYDLLQYEYPKLDMRMETDCSRNFYDWLSKNNNYLMAFFTDDCIFYRPNAVGEDELLNLFKMQNMWTFTYRLGNNITIQDYTQENSTSRPRVFAEKKNSIFWDYRQCLPDHSFGWPCGLDGYIWKTVDLKELLNGETFNNFTRLEGVMMRKWREKKPYQYLMSSPINSSIVVEQINVVHSDRHNNIGKFVRSCETLNDEFLQGKRASLSSMDFSNINCTHSEIPFTME